MSLPLNSEAFGRAVDLESIDSPRDIPLTQFYCWSFLPCVASPQPVALAARKVGKLIASTLEACDLSIFNDCKRYEIIQKVLCFLCRRVCAYISLVPVDFPFNTAIMNMLNPQM